MPLKRVPPSACFSSGHKLVSLPVKEVVDPVKGCVVRTYWAGCEKCGQELDKIQEEKNHAGTGS